ncbi:hypothetical protein FXV77_14245 [Sphingobacterium phlebotomi]|uniref:Fibrobacter succinogenes major paralogous domain-containing protein n=1 Tax=Sphingobacterium phlebotomi TaxID=2605433 RepID=A0A5D4H4C0_9SPHI|nr:FISUMP domain-containing protein [Sphingobacterium phlebotomi]TYR35103.1 hypothetical protein FXV77_14245 [Sphingobacterium phlebotomi]
MNTRKICLGFMGLTVFFVILSCKKDKETDVMQPDFIQTSLPASMSIDGGIEFDLYIPDNEEGVRYDWVLPDLLTLTAGEGTNRITVVGGEEGGVVQEKSIGVTADRVGNRSYTRWLYKEIAVLTPPPTLPNYRTKRYGAKTWMIENLNEAGEDGNLGWTYNNDPGKADIYGRLYTWHEAMTGVSNATEGQNPYTWGSSGTDDVGNSYILDGTYVNSYNIQIQGACPEGWHIPNMNDWYDLLVAIKQEYGIPGNSLADVANSKDGYIIAWGRETGVVNAMNLTNWGVIGPYLKGSNPMSVGGLWQGGTTFNYGGNAVFPSGAYPLYKDKSSELEFNILPSGRRTAASVFNDEGLYSYHWVAYRGAASPNNPLRLTIGSSNANFSNGLANPLDAHCLRCVANY